MLQWIGRRPTTVHMITWSDLWIPCVGIIGTYQVIFSWVVYFRTLSDSGDRTLRWWWFWSRLQVRCASPDSGPVFINTIGKCMVWAIRPSRKYTGSCWFSCPIDCRYNSNIGWYSDKQKTSIHTCTKCTCKVCLQYFS